MFQVLPRSGRSRLLAAVLPIEVRREGVQSRLEERLELVYPGRDVGKRFRLKPIDSLPPCTSLGDQVGVLKHSQMLRNGSRRDVERCGQLARSFFAGLQEDQHRPPSRVGNRVEHVILLQGSHESRAPFRIGSEQFIEPMLPVGQWLSVELRFEAIEQRMKARQKT